MDLSLQFAITLQIMFAAVLTGLIGMERERNDHSAGLRTHMVVGIGSCLFAALSISGFPDGDPSRVAAQIVSGIGFLGAGLIFVRGNEAKNLTTAASIWTTAGIGLAVGVGAWLLAITATLLIWFTLHVLNPISNRIGERSGSGNQESQS